MDVDDTSSRESLISNCSITAGKFKPSIIKAKILSGEYQVVNKRGCKSKVWELFGLIENAWGEEMENVVYCRQCSSVYKYSRSTSNLIRHKCYALTRKRNVLQLPEDDSDEVRKSGVRMVTNWIIDNCRSYEIMDDSGLKSFAELLVSVGARYGENVNIEKLLPSVSTISKNIERLYDVYSAKIRNEMHSIKDVGFGLTSALWNDNYLRTTCISLTIHYIQDGLLINRLLGIKYMKSERFTAEKTELEIRKLLNDYNCELDDKATIVTDRDAIMVSEFLSCNHIYCINQLLHDVLEKSTKEVPQIAELYCICMEMVQYLLMIGIDSTLETTLKYSCVGRWNRIYYFLDAISNNWDEITNILKYENKLQKLKNINLDCITALAGFLHSFEETSKKLEAKNNVTLHLVYIHIHRLKKICIVETGDLEIIRCLKEKLNSFIETHVLQYITVYHKIALFLFPPANKLIPFSDSDRILVKDECKRIMARFLGEISDEVKVHNITTVSSHNADLFNDFVQPIENESTHSEDRVNSEIVMYQSTNVLFHDDFNILQWWHLHQEEFPLLYKLSCQILAIPASSASSERTFSAARNLMAETKYVIDLKSINQIMFLHSNIREHDLSLELEREILIN